MHETLERIAPSLAHRNAEVQQRAQAMRTTHAVAAREKELVVMPELMGDHGVVELIRIVVQIAARIAQHVDARRYRRAAAACGKTDGEEKACPDLARHRIGLPRAGPDGILGAVGARPEEIERPHVEAGFGLMDEVLRHPGDIQDREHRRGPRTAEPHAVPARPCVQVHGHRVAGRGDRRGVQHIERAVRGVVAHLEVVAARTRAQ